MHIGKVSILPAVFHEDGTIKDYYLYISPEYILSPYNQRTNPNMDANNEWLKLNFISTKNNELLGFKSEQNNGLCSVSSDGQIFNPDNNEWSSPVSGENGNLVFDTVNSSALFLGTEGIKFLSNNKSFTCKALSQWVAPANQVESVSDDLVISSFDNHTLATCIPRGFYRELLTQRKLNLSAKAIDGKRLSMGISGSNITVNEVASQNVSVPSSLNIFKNAVSIRLLNVISSLPNDCGIEWDNNYPIALGYEPKGTPLTSFNYFYCYINPDTGELTKIYVPYPDIEIDRSQYEYFVMSYNFSLQIINQQICWLLIIRDDDNSFHYYNNYITITDIPTSIKQWGGGSDNCGIVLNSLCYPCVSVDNAVSKKLSCCLNAIFNEVATNTKFAYEIPSWAKIDSNGDTSGLLPYYYMQHLNVGLSINNYGDINSYKKDYRNRNRSMSNIHIIGRNANVVVYNDFVLPVRQYLIFRSDLNSNVFDFDNELLRSVVS